MLALLRAQQGGYLSGEAMSQTLGISRTAIWKIINGLRLQGYEIDSVSNKGYCLVDHPNLLEQGRLTAQLSHCQIGKRLHCFDTIDSTNTQMKRLATEGEPHGTVILSEEQTGGRGRYGRTFSSPKGTGVYLSLLLRPKCTAVEMTDFTAWVAVAVADAIEECCGVTPQIKWTNDLVLGGKKICGILTELGLDGDSGELDYVVVGIGVNVNQKQEDFPPEIAEMATSIAAEQGGEVDRTDLATHLITKLDQLVTTFPQQKEKYLDQYRTRCITIGKQVQVITPTTRRQAMAIGIDDQFRLEVLFEDGTNQALSTGEVSVRGMYGYV